MQKEDSNKNPSNQILTNLNDAQTHRAKEGPKNTVFFAHCSLSLRKFVAENPPSSFQFGSPLLFFSSPSLSPKVRVHVGTLAEKVNETTESGLELPNGDLHENRIGGMAFCGR